MQCKVKANSVLLRIKVDKATFSVEKKARIRAQNCFQRNNIKCTQESSEIQVIETHLAVSEMNTEDICLSYVNDRDLSFY